MTNDQQQQQPTPEPLSDERLAEIQARVERTSPGPWEMEVTWHAPDDDLHVAIHTRDKLPAHPWSPRFIAWMTGVVARPIGDLQPRRQHCPTCDHVFYRSREVPFELRADDDIQADADFIAHAPTDVRDLLGDHERLRAENEQMHEIVAAVAQAETKKMTWWDGTPAGCTLLLTNSEIIDHARALLAALGIASSEGEMSDAEC